MQTDSFEAIAASPLQATRGLLRARLLDDEQLARLQQDAWDRSTSAIETAWKRRGTHQGRLPDYWFDFAPGGQLLHSFYRADSTLEALARITGIRLAPDGDHGAYKYYRHPGHHVGLHRDRKEVNVTVITCLHHDPGPGGELAVYPDRSHEPIEWIARTPSVGAQWLRLAPGESVVIAGWLVAHRVRPMSAGRTRIVTSLGYRDAS